MHRDYSMPCGPGGGVFLMAYGKKTEVILLWSVISLAISC